jgi:hypothetical protein
LDEVSDDDFKAVTCTKNPLTEDEMDARFDFADAHLELDAFVAASSGLTRVFADETWRILPVSGGRYLHGVSAWCWRGEREHVTIFGAIGERGFVSKLRFAYGVFDAAAFAGVAYELAAEADAAFGPFRYLLYLDGSGPHVALPAVAELRRRLLLMRGWPAHSFDLNPIEPFLKLLMRRVLRREPRTRAELEEFAVEEWAKVATAERVSEAVGAFLPRLRLVRQLGGGDSGPYSEGHRLVAVQLELLRRVRASAPARVDDQRLTALALTLRGPRKWHVVGRRCALSPSRVKHRAEFLESVHRVVAAAFSLAGL